MKNQHNYCILFLFFVFIINYNYSQITASFSVDLTEGCPPLFVTFTNTSSSNATNFKWDFGNNKTSVEENPSTTYTETGNYTVTLIVDNGSEFDTLQINNLINVFEKPGSNFEETSLTHYCEDDNIIQFTNLSTGATSFFWDFGDGNFSNEINTIHQFSQAGEFNVKLKASNDYCDSLFSIPIIINPTPSIAALSQSNFSCDSNSIVSFSAFSSNAIISNWNWDFGDGTNINTVNQDIEYTYNQTGTFFPMVRGTTNHNCVDSFFLESIIFPEIDDYVIQSNSALSGCPPLDVNFSISPTTSIETVNWDFTNSIVTNGQTTVINNFPVSGIYNVSSELIDTNGCIQNIEFNESVNVITSPEAQYSNSNSSGCPPLDVEFNVSTDPSNSILWEFGDTLSPSSTEQNVINTYSYSGTFNPSLTVLSPNGCSTQYYLESIQAGMTLTNFNANPRSGCATLEVDFFNSAPEYATEFFWDFGDGNTSTEANPTHVYDTIGEYSVTFQCSDSNGCSSQYVIPNMIKTYGEDDVELPNQDTIYACSPYTFSADASNIGESYWNWDFGDGYYGSGENVTHQYTKSGIYTVILNADAPNMCMYNILNYATIVIDDNIEIDLDITINDECDNGFIDVINNSTGVVDHLWDMGDGGVVRTPDITHSYTTTNSYLVSYQALTQSGCLVIESIAVIFKCDENLNPIVEADTLIITEDTTQADTLITGPLIDPVTNEVITQNCGPELINLNTPFDNADSVFWDFGDGYTSSDPNPTHLYQNAGTFDLTHYAYFSDGHSDTLIIANFIDQYMLDASFTLEKTDLCNEAKYEFENLASGQLTYEWKIGSEIISTESSDEITLSLNDSVKTLSLKVEDNYGCVNESQQNLFLYHPLVIIEDTNFACNSSPANFIASVVGDPDHYWMLESDTLGTDTSISYSFNVNGFFEVVLELDDQGCKRFITLDTIEIFQPDASFSPSSYGSICNNDSILFIANDRSFNSSEYNWSGGKVLVDGDSTWIQFQNEGKQIVSLSLSERTCTNIFSSDTIIVNKANANYSYVQSNYCIPINVQFQDSSVNAVNWIWNFGDGNISNDQNPFHTFNTMPTDSIELIITDLNGCKDSIRSVIINDLNANFFADDTLICANTPVIFNGVDSIVSTWSWDFGDGTNSTDSIPTHYYENEGIYEVRLSVSDGQGCNDTVIKSNYIEVQKVIADFEFSVPNECPSVTVFFTNNSTGGTEYIWDFGDGANNIENNNNVVAHEYDSSGYFNPNLIATNDAGCADTLTNNDTLIIPGPLLNFSISKVGECDSLTIIIHDSSTKTVEYTWDFGDGNSSFFNPNDTTITHTYTNPGVYNVILIGLDAANCANTYTSTDTIKHFLTPTIDVLVDEQNICIGSSPSFQNNTEAEIHYWYYNNQTFNEKEPLINIAFQDSNQIFYVASNDSGKCADSSIYTIIGHSIPDPTITSDTLICENLGSYMLSSLTEGGTWNGNFVDESSGEIDLLLSGVGVFDFIYEISGYCPIQKDSISIEVIASPDINVTIEDTNLCLNSEISILNNTIADNHNWQYNNQTFNTLEPIVIVDTTGSVPLQYIASNSIANCTTTEYFNIIGYSVPNPEIISDTVICENLELFTLIATDQGGIWSGESIDSVSGVIDINNIGPGTFNYVYKITGFCPPQIDSVSIEIIEFIDADINSSQDYCEGTDTVQFSASPENGVWSGLENTHLENGSYFIDSLSDGTYEVYYTLLDYCPDTDTLLFTILPEPEISLELFQEKPCLSIPINITNNSANLANEKYSWYVNDSLIYDSILNFTNPYFLLDTGFYEIKTIVTNENNCKNEFIFDSLIYVYDTTSLNEPKIIRSTVFNNINVYTEWEDYPTYLNPINKNTLYRKVNDDDYQFIIELDTNVHHYLDEDVDVFNNFYSYYLVSKSVCEVNSNNSNSGTSILLDYEKSEELKTRLFWNKYNNWVDGINRYEIQKLNENNDWIIIKTVESLNNSIIIDE